MSLEFSHGPEQENTKAEAVSRVNALADQLEAWWEGGAERVQYVKDHLLENADDLSDAIGVIADTGDAEVLKLILDRPEGLGEISNKDITALNKLAHKHGPKALEGQRDLFRKLNQSRLVQGQNIQQANTDFNPELPPPAYLEGMPEAFLLNVYEVHYSEGSSNQLWLQSFPDSPLADPEEVDIYAETQLAQIRDTGDLYRCKTDPLSMHGVFANPNCKPKRIRTLVHAMFNHVLDNPNDPRDQEKIRKLDELVFYHGGAGALEDFEAFKEEFNNPEDDIEARA